MKMTLSYGGRLTNVTFFLIAYPAVTGVSGNFRFMTVSVEFRISGCDWSLVAFINCRSPIRDDRFSNPKAFICLPRELH